MANLKLVPLKKVSPFRKIAIGTWKTAYDPSVYGSMDLRMEQTLEYMEAFRRRTGRNILDLLLENGMDRAEALLRAGDITGFLALTALEATYGANFQSKAGTALRDQGLD